MMKRMMKKMVNKAMVKKVMAMTMGMMMAAAITACGGTKPQAASNVQIPNPFVDCKTMDEAGKLAGFDMTVPEKIGENEKQFIQAVDGEMIQVFYSDESMDNETENSEKVLIRKAAGNQDISGDYNEYAEQKDMEVNGLTVSTKGNDGKIYLATWTDGGYSYSVSMDEGTDMENVTVVVEAVK